MSLFHYVGDVRTPKRFSLKATALSHGWHECAPLSWTEGGRCFQIVLRNRNHAYRVSVTARGSRSGERLRVFIDGPAPAEDRLAERFLHQLRAVLALDRDLTEFYALCEEHPRLRLIPLIGGGRLIRAATMSENILKFLCSTNVNWTQAVKMINRLAQLGPPVRHFVSLNAWPTPEEILRAGRSYLTDVCRLGYRADSVLAFCRSAAEGRFDPESLVAQAESDAVSSDDLAAQLRRIKGIGPASAHGLLSLLGRYDRLSIDSATIAHAARVHFNGRKPTPKEVHQIYEPFGRWKNLVYWCENWLTWHTADGMIQEVQRRRVDGRDAVLKRDLLDEGRRY